MPQLEPAVLHASAIADTAEANLAALGAALTVYRDAVPADPSWPYVVFWSATAQPLFAAERLAGWGGDVETVTQATVAGLTRLDVIGGIDRLTLALHRRKPSIPDRRVGDFEFDAAGQPVRDPTPTPGGLEPWSAPVFFRLTSSPVTNS